MNNPILYSSTFINISIIIYHQILHVDLTKNGGLNIKAEWGEEMYLCSGQGQKGGIDRMKSSSFIEQSQ